MRRYNFTHDKPLPDYGLFGARARFSSMTLELTQICSNACVFCPKDHKKYRHSMTLEDLDVVLSRLPVFEGFVTLNIFGDALVLDDLALYIKKISTRWPKAIIRLTSSLNLERNEDYFQSIFEAGLKQIKVSCYAFTDDSYQKLHGTRRLSHVYRNIALLKKMSGLADDTVLPALFAYGEEAFGVAVKNDERLPYLRFLQDNGIQKIMLRRPHSWQGRIPGRFGHSEGATTDFSLAEFTPCPAVWGSIAGHLNITAQLDIVPCCVTSSHDGVIFGNLRQSSLEEIFNSQAYRRFYEAQWARRKKIYAVCRDCHYPLEYASSAELCRMAAFAGSLLAGQKVYYWGYGEVFKSYEIFFRQSRPQAILVDKGEGLPTEHNAVPLRHPDDILPKGEKLPIVLFAGYPGNVKILETIRKKYPGYKPTDIVLAHPILHDPFDREVMVSAMVESLQSFNTQDLERT